MKKILVYVMAVTMIGMFSCSEEEDSSAEIGYPGMGSRVDEALTISEEFVLPEGVEISSKIVGTTPTYSTDLKSNSDEVVDVVTNGLGGQFITLVFDIINNNMEDLIVELPAGLLFKLIDDIIIIDEVGYSIEDFQRGIVLNYVNVGVGANDTTTVVLNLFCLNKGLNGSTLSEPGVCLEYEIVGTTDAESILTLIDAINVEPYQYLDESISDTFINIIEEGEYTDSELAYFTENIQRMLWYLTNHSSEYAMTKAEICEALQGLFDENDITF